MNYELRITNYELRTTNDERQAMGRVFRSSFIIPHSALPLSPQSSVLSPVVRSAFTLTEVLVALALLILVMGMASTVFRVALGGTTRLTAQSDIDRKIRLFGQQLEHELGHIDPTQSIMAIQGNPTPAYWTQKQKVQDYNSGPGQPGIFDGITSEALSATVNPISLDPERENPTRGYDPLDSYPSGTGDGSFDLPTTGAGSRDDNAYPALPRADVLMFITNDPQAHSYVLPEVQSDGPVMITYSHAILGHLDPKTTNVRVTGTSGQGPGAPLYTYNGVDYDNDSTNDWAGGTAGLKYIPHLRSFNNGPTMDDGGWVPGAGGATGFTPLLQDVAADWHLARRAILLKDSFDQQENDSVAANRRDRFAHVLSPTDPRGNTNYQTIPLPLSASNIQTYEVEYLNWILGGEMDVVSPVGAGLVTSAWPFPNNIQDFVFDYEVSNRYFGGPAATLDWLAFDRVNNATGLPPADGSRDPGVADGQVMTRTGNLSPGFWRGAVPAFWLARSILDPAPPPTCAHRLGNYFLPNCASFKVEWTPNDVGGVDLSKAGLPEIIWLDPFKEPSGNNRLSLPAVTAFPNDSITPSGLTGKPVHLDEFEILAQKMKSDPGRALGASPDNGHRPLGIGNKPDYPFGNPYLPVSDLNYGPGSILWQVHQKLLSRFGLSNGTVNAAQSNVFDAMPDPVANPGVQPSYNVHSWYSRDLDLRWNPIPAPGHWEPKTSDSPDPMWPKALRITVDIFDEHGNFETPVRHVYVVKVGNR